MKIWGLSCLLACMRQLKLLLVSELSECGSHLKSPHTATTVLRDDRFIRDKRLKKYYLNGVDAFRLKVWFS